MINYINGEINIVLDEGAFEPTRAHDTDAGYDLYAREDAVVPAKGSYKFDTGVHIELPEILICNSITSERCLVAGLIKSKSGLNVNHDITSDGVIDVDYTGKIAVKLYNHGDKDYEVKRGDKISQLLIVPVLTPKLKTVDKLKKTQRGDAGFGSTGR